MYKDILLKQYSKGLCETVFGSIWHHTKIRFMNRCSLEALSRSLSSADNLHLNCIAHTAWCTAPEEVQKEMEWFQEQLHIIIVFLQQT